MLWTIILVTLGVTGTWLAPRTWWGWVINGASEVLWFAYALTIHAPALAIMSVVWGVVHVRNATITRRPA